MAAIDKIYIDTYQHYLEFRKWCAEQPKLKDKYGTEVLILDYFFTQWDDEECWGKGDHPVMSAPYYIDAYIIRNCPLDYVQRELMVNYGHKTQEDIDKMYETISNRTAEEQAIIDDAGGRCPKKPIPYWWLSLADFRIVNGIVTMPHMAKSSYQEILDGELYASPSLVGKYPVGRHFKIVRHPFHQRRQNYPIPIRRNGVKFRTKWAVSVELPEHIEESIWWHMRNIIGTWDFASEFVAADGSCSHTHCKSLRGIKRRIRKWQLPVGAVVEVSGMYIGEDYTIIVKK